MDSRSDDRSQIATLAGAFLQLMNLGVVVAVLPFYGMALHGKAWQIALLFSASALGALISEPMWGKLSDRVGRKPVLVASLVLSGICAGAMTFCGTIWAAIAMRALFGLAAGNISTFQAAVLDTSSPGEQVRRVGRLGAAFSLAFVIGPVVGGALSDPAAGASGFSLPICIGALLSGSAAAIVWILVRYEPPLANRSGASTIRATTILSAPGIFALLAMTAILVSGFAGLDSSFGLWAKERFAWGPAELGRCFMLFGLVSALVQGAVTPRLSSHIGTANVLKLGAALTGAGLAATALTPFQSLAVVALALTIAGEGMVQPSLPVLIARILPSPEMEGTALGLNMSVASVARVIAPVAIGAVYSATGSTAAMLFCSLFSFAGVGLALLFRLCRRPVLAR